MCTQTMFQTSLCLGCMLNAVTIKQGHGQWGQGQTVPDTKNREGEKKSGRKGKKKREKRKGKGRERRGKKGE